MNNAPPLETYKKFYPRTARENEKLYVCIKMECQIDQ